MYQGILRRSSFVNLIGWESEQKAWCHTWATCWFQSVVGVVYKTNIETRDVGFKEFYPKPKTQNPKPLSSPPMLKKKKNKLIQIWVVLWVFVQQAPKNSKQSVPCQSFNHFILVVHTHLSLYPIAKLHKFN
jgi:hypothetical protein